MSQQINEWSKNAINTSGLSETMAKRYTGTFGAMAKSFDFAEAEALNMICNIVVAPQDNPINKIKKGIKNEIHDLRNYRRKS